MAITNYTQLKDAIANFLARDDLTDQLENFVQLAEARMIILIILLKLEQMPQEVRPALK